jgi:hypothetical protein
MPTYQQGTEPPLFEPGVYWFQTSDAILKRSRENNNPMIELELVVLGRDGKEPIELIDRLVFTPKSGRRIDHYRKATGEVLEGKGEVNFEPRDCLDREGFLILKVEEYQGRKTNKVEDYVVDPDSIDPQVRRACGENKNRPIPKSPSKPTLPDLDAPEDGKNPF